jgi:hypothetical protein
MDLGPGGLSSPGPSGFGGGYNATGTDYNASGGSNEPVMFPEQLNLPRPETPKFAQTIQKAIDSPFGKAAQFVSKTKLYNAYPVFGLASLGLDIYNAGGIGPYFQQQKETLQNLLNQPTITAPPVITTGGDNQPIIPRIPMVAETPTDVDGTLSDLDMYIQNLRAQTPTPFALDPRFAAAEGGVARQAYGLGSLVRKATKGIKKIFKSDIGKAALVAAGAYGITRPGFSSFIKEKVAPMLLKDPSSKYFGLEKGLTGIGQAALIAGPSALAYFSTPEEEEDNLSGISDRVDTSGLKQLIARYPELRFQVPTQYQLAANGGRIGYAEGGMMDLGGMEKDYRAEGGFVPIGAEEKADDVPARLSKNEFVFTADAVRSAGDGDIDKGAEVMYNVMKNLESGGKISEESQGLQGARDMFQTSQRLGEIL